MAVKQTSAVSAFVNPYLPQILMDWYGESRPGTIHHTTGHEGIVVCLDASGFTNLTRRMSVDKKLGPEHLTSILNGFFRSVTDLVFEYRGDILKFAGDAVWIYFHGTIEISDFYQHALRTVEELNKASSDLQNSPIGIHIGAELGAFGLASMGKDGFRLEAEPFGPMINEVMRACDLATTGQMVLGADLAGRIPQHQSLAQPEAGFYLLEPTGQLSGEKFNSKPASPAREMAHDSRLEQYLPRDFIERARFTSQITISQSEVRDVTVIFANFRSSVGHELEEADNEITSINNKLSSAFDIIAHSGGSIARIDPFYDGHKLLVLFGAPKKHEADELNALYCATKLLELVDTDFNLRIGLAHGSLFCGDVGTDRRREYTVMGEAVNMAARLMANTPWGGILIDGHLQNKLPPNIQTTKKRLALKGLDKNLLCYQFREIIESVSFQSGNNRIIGRKPEYQQLEKFLNPILSSKFEIMVITGGAGVGKSTLVENAISSNDNLRSITIAGRHSFLYGHAWMARKLLNELFSLSKKTDPQSLEDFAAERIESTWLPLLSDIIDVPVEDNVWLKGLSQEQRSQKTAELYGRLATAIVTEPVVVVIDDFDRIGDFSRQLILQLLDQPEQLPGKFILISREDTSTGKLGSSNLSRLSFPPPTDSEWRSYFKRQFADGKREIELTNRLIDISRGNPLFILEFIDHLHEQDKLQLNRVTGLYELIESFGGSEIPDSISDIYLSRFDLLPEPDKRLLKAAAVFEIMFGHDALSAVTEHKDTKALKLQLNDLVEAEVFEYDSDNGSFGFADKTFQSIINSCLSESFLLASHTKVVNYFESSGVTVSPSVLAHHYFKSKQWQKAFAFSLTAAREALRLFALSEASALFEQCAISLELSKDNQIPVADIYEFYVSYNSYLVLEGDLDKAYEMLGAWKDFAEKDSNKFQNISAILQKAHLDWQQSKYNECRNALAGALRYPDIQEHSSLIARVHAILAEVERRSGNFSLAQECCQKSISSYKDLKDYRGLSDAHNKLGLALWGEGKLDEAAENYELSLRYGKDVNGMIVQSQTSNNLAIIKWEQGDFVKAEQLMREALEITKQIGDRRVEAYVSGNLSSIQNILGRFSSSRKLLLQADLIFRRLNDSHAHNYVIGNLGDIDLIEGNSDEAGAKFNQVIKFATEVEDKELLAECQIRLGEVLFYTGRIEEAKIKYKKAIRLASQIESSEYFMRSAIGLCRLYIGECDLGEIDSLIDKTLVKATKSNSILVKNEIGFIKGESNRLRNKLSEANHCYHETLEYALQQNVFELTLKSSVRLFEHDSAFKDKATEILSGTRRQFEMDNGEASWGQLMTSCYYQFFSKTISQMV